MSDEFKSEAEAQGGEQETPVTEAKPGKKAKAVKKKLIAAQPSEEEVAAASAVVEASEPIETSVAAKVEAQSDQHNELFEQGVQSLLRGEYDAADNFFGQALTDYRKQGDQAGQISVLEQLGHLCFLRGAEAQAREYYQQAGAMRGG